jgi:sterol desaturase/sphingolipid hydroxylase (fatty acid hydroxylase superfamily)
MQGTFANTPALMIVPLLALLLMLTEWLYIRLALHDYDAYDVRETAGSLMIAIGNILLRPLTAIIGAIPLYHANKYRILDAPERSLASFCVLFVLVDLIGYWYHRMSHRIRFLWATHAVHHSTTKLNLTAAVRNGGARVLSGAVFFYLPLTLIGFHPLATAGIIQLNLLYQFLLHTHLSLRLGPLEWVLNTPSHHRVHHATNDECLNKNFGGVLILWDRMFGTFAEGPKEEPLRYGLLHSLPSQGPIVVYFYEWARLLSDTRRANSFWTRLKVLCSAPVS